MFDNEKLYDYCLREYAPQSDVTGKLHSEAILAHMSKLLGMEKELGAVINEIKEKIGENKTVWGILQVKDKIIFELYFYDYSKFNRSVSIQKIKNALSNFNCNFPVADNIPYFMFSLNFDKDSLHKKEIDAVHVYVHNPPSLVPSANSYALSITGTELENSYYFYDPKAQREALLSKIYSSPFLCNAGRNIGLVLDKTYVDCRTICIANKKNADCLYYSGINIVQFLNFLDKFDYPRDLVQYIEGNQDKLDHLLFDIGYDVRLDTQQLIINKSGFYGVF
jgi:hypothetical protein